jgi:uncharacterized protein (TIGR02453 family)
MIAMATRPSDDGFGGWPRAAFDWFDGLEMDNSKEWFHANRATYDHDVKGPMVALLAELENEFGPGRLSRPNRDTRFSADKTPYKDQIYGRIERPGGSYYVRLWPEGFFVGGGVYMPDAQSMARLRAAIADDRTGSELERRLAAFRSAGAELILEGGLKTAPRGYSADHPRIDLLRLKHLAGGTEHRLGPWIHTTEARERVVAGWRAVTPLLDWVVEST